MRTSSWSSAWSRRSARLAVGLFSVSLALASAGRAFGEGPMGTRLNAESAQRARLETLVVAASELAQKARGYGRVLDPLPIVDAVAGFEATIASDASASAELARVAELAQDQQNASLRELAAARATAARARSDLAMFRARVVAAVGGVLAREPGLSTLAARLAAREASLIRVDVAGSEPAPRPERGLDVSTYPESGRALAVRYVGPAPAVDPAQPGWGLLLLVTSGPPPPPGTAVVARVATDEVPLRGVRVPDSALVLQADRRFVFVDRGNGLFERRSIESVLLEDGSQFVTKGIVAGERIVVTGAQQLLSNETLGDAAEEPE